MTRKNGWRFTPALIGSLLLGCATARNGAVPAGVQQNGTLTPEVNVNLVIPLDNIGIADWHFLNPRSPRSVFPEVPSLLQSPALLDRFVAAKLVATAIPNLPQSRRDTIEDILDIGNNAVHNLSSSQAYKDAIIGRTLQAVWRASDQNPALQPPGAATETPCGQPPLQDQDPSLESIDAEAMALTCSASSWALEELERVPSVGEESIYNLAKATLIAIASAQTIVTTQTAHQPDAKITVAKAAKVLKDTRAAWDTGRQDLKDVADSNLNEGTKRIVAELAAQKAQATIEGLRGGANVAAEESIKAVLQRTVVRFFNRTFDRSFIVSLQLKKDSLLRSVRTDCPGAKGKDDDSIKLSCLVEEYGGDINFSAKDNVVTASFTVGPQIPFDLDAWLLSKAPKSIVPFDVDFFDQTDDPAYSQGFVALYPVDPKDASAQPDDKFTTNLIAGITGKDEPCFGKPDENCEPDKKNPWTPYDGDSRRHLSATGQLDLSQSLGNRANAKLSLQYRSSDFGGKDAAKEKVGFSQYQVNIFGVNDTIFSIGKFTFAQPASKISIFEEGDGLRLTYKNATVSYILRRESNDGVSDSHDKDSYSLLGEYKQSIPLQFLRRIDLIYLRGKDGCKSDTTNDGACIVPDYTHTYYSYGAELFFTIPFPAARSSATPSPMVGSFASYVSDVDSRLNDNNHPDGRGSTYLFTLGRPFGFVSDSTPGKVKPQRVLTGLFGWGSGDDPSTSRNEGYVGERAGFSRDLVFMNGLVKSLPPDLQKSIGPGLSNKTYAGLQYSDTHISPLQWITMLLGTQDDVASQSMTFSAHYYRFHEAILGKRDAGTEYDADFRIEVPKSIKWRVSIGYFSPGNALDSLTKHLLSVSAGVVLEPGRLF